MSQMNWPYYAVDCPEDILQKYRNISTTTRAPVSGAAEKSFSQKLLDILLLEQFILISNCVAVVVFLIVLFVNQKKYNKSHALYLFCWSYIGIQLILSLISISDQIYKINWRNIWNSNILCQIDESVTPVKIIRPVGLSFPKWYIGAKAIKSLIDRSVYFFVLPILLGFHRITVYFACSYPFIFKKYFNDSMLKRYYIIIGIFGALIAAARYLRNEYLTTPFAVDAVFAFVQILSCLFHVILTMLAIRIVFNFQKTSISVASQEVKGFLFLSILPITLSIISMVINTAYVIFAIMRYIDPKNTSYYSLYNFMDSVRAINDEFIATLNPIISSFFMLICIPTYREVWMPFFPCYKGTNVTVLDSQTPNSVSSKISFSSQFVAVTHK